MLHGESQWHIQWPHMALGVPACTGLTVCMLAQASRFRVAHANLIPGPNQDRSNKPILDSWANATGTRGLLIVRYTHTSVFVLACTLALTLTPTLTLTLTITLTPSAR